MNSDFVWWTAVKKPSKIEKKAVLGYFHTKFSYVREKKKN